MELLDHSSRLLLSPLEFQFNYYNSIICQFVPFHIASHIASYACHGGFNVEYGSIESLVSDSFYDCFALLPSGLPVVAFKDNISQYDPISNKALHSFKACNNSTIVALTVMQLPDGRTLLATGTSFGILHFWDTSSWSLLHTIPCNTMIRCLLFLDSSMQLLCSRNNGNIDIYNVPDGEFVSSIENAHSALGGGPREMVLLSNNHVATCGADKLIRIWDMNTKTCIKEWKTEVSFAHLLPLSDGRLCSGAEELLVMWNTVSGEMIASRRFTCKYLHLLAIEVVFNKSIELVSTTLSKQQEIIDAKKKEKENWYIVSSQRDGYINVWGPELQFIRSLQVTDHPIHSLFVLPNGSLYSRYS